MLYKKFFKRPIDIIISSFALIILMPVLLLTAILIRIKMGSPVIFKQERPGLNERIFKMYKFRTMIDARDKDNKPLPDADRITKLGKFLRKTSIDEFPELLNIIKGDMSLVGPRPLLVEYLPYYTEEERLRHTVRPGLTGLAQVKGRNLVDWDKRLKMDQEYVRSVSLLLDIKILSDTVLNVIRMKDVKVIQYESEDKLSVIRSRKYTQSKNNL